MAGNPGSKGPKGVKGAKGSMGKWRYINDERNCTKVKGHTIGVHSFSTCAKFYETLTFLTGGTHVCVSGVRNVSFFEKFLYVLNQ